MSTFQNRAVKPVRLVEDAILDCSKRGGLVLDGFVGSGTTLIAAERSGRRSFGLECEPHYVDLALQRFRTFTGIEPLHVKTGLTLKELARTRHRARLLDRPIVKRKTRRTNTAWR